MRLNGTDVVSLVLIAEGGRLTWELSEYPLYWCEAAVTRELIQGGNAFRESHVHLTLADDIGLLDYLVEHLLKRLISAFDSADLFRAFKSGRIDQYAFLCQRVVENTSVVRAAISRNELGPTEGSDPAPYEGI